MLTREAIVDLAFPLQGATIPADHGYPVYAAVSRCLPSFHADRSVGIHPIRGHLVGRRLLALGATSRLVLRVPEARIPEAIRLAGQHLEVDGSTFSVGVPTVQPLKPAAFLISRLVIIRGFTEADAFLDAARRQLAALDVEGTPALVPRRASRSFEGRSSGGEGTFVRRTLRIREKEVVGFAVCVDQLTADESVRLQEAGLGGRRRFGCGIFVPSER